MSIKDLTGQKFGKLTAVKYIGKDKGYRSLWLFKCDCGKEKVIQAYNVYSGKTISCGCYHKQKISEISLKDYTGKKFGKLLAIKRIREEGSKQTYYLCRCDCGNELKVLGGSLTSGNTKSCGCLNKTIYYNKNLIGKTFGRLYVVREECKESGDITIECKCQCGNIVNVSKNNLIRGNTKSCGCLQKEVARKNFSTHSLSKTSLYKKYLKMIERCENPNSRAYKYYGLRGIKVCAEWRNNFVKFYNWAYTNGYKENLTIERIDVNGNYCPENCKWIPLEEQAKNKTNTILISYNNETHILSDWAKITGYSAQTIKNRLNKFGYDNLDKVIKYKGE